MSTAIKAIILYQLEFRGNVLFGTWGSFHANHSHGHVIWKRICLQLLCKWYSYFKWDVSGRNRLGCICESWFGISKQQPLFELLLLVILLELKARSYQQRCFFHSLGSWYSCAMEQSPPFTVPSSKTTAANDCTLQGHWTSGFVVGVGMPWQAMTVTVTSQLPSKELDSSEIHVKENFGKRYWHSWSKKYYSCCVYQLSEFRWRGKWWRTQRKWGLLKGDIRNYQSITFTVFSWSKPITGTAQIHGGGRKDPIFVGGVCGDH